MKRPKKNDKKAPPLGEMLIEFCKSRMSERQWSVSSGYELRAINDFLDKRKNA